MPKRIILSLLLLIIYLFPLTHTIQAASGSCIIGGQTWATASWPDAIKFEDNLEISVNFTNKALVGKYYIVVSSGVAPPFNRDFNSNKVDLSSSQLVDGEEVTFQITDKIQPPGFINPNQSSQYYVKLQRDGIGLIHDICNTPQFGTINISAKSSTIADAELEKAQCPIATSSKIMIGDSFILQESASHPSLPNIKFLPLIYKASDFSKIPQGVFNAKDYPVFATGIVPNKFNVKAAVEASNIQDTTYQTGSNTMFPVIDDYVAAIAVINTPIFFGPSSRAYICGSFPFKIGHAATTLPGTPMPSRPPGAGGGATPGAPSGLPNTGPGTAGGVACVTGFRDERGNDAPAVQTAIGCVPTEPIAFIKAMFRFLLGIGGGIAFLIMVMGVFQMMTSAGNPDQLKNGSEMLTNAIVGILFIIFSVLFLQIIGAGILNIPGFR